MKNTNQERVDVPRINADQKPQHSLLPTTFLEQLKL